MKDLSELIDFTKEQPSCKGLMFRGNVNSFVDKREKYVYQETMSLLKKLSCSGCQQCEFLRDDLKERAGEGAAMLPIITNIENGCLYELKAVNQETDWESGYIDNWDLEFVKIVDKKIDHVQIKA